MSFKNSSISGRSYIIFSSPCFLLIKLGIYSMGPGLYKAFIAIKSSKTVGFKSFRCFCMPGDSYWKIPTVSPLWNISKVFLSSIGKLSGSNWIPYLAFTIFTVSLIKVRVFNPRKSIFNNPACSTTALSNCVTNKSESFAVAMGTKFLISSGVIITPQACIPVFLSEPSNSLACLMVSDSRLSDWEILNNWFILSKSSSLNLFLNSLWFVSKIELSLVMLGTNFAILSASPKGKSKTLAVSLIDDLAAIVP